jgi:fido (protein-threonine AMPylation protein)
MVEVSSGVTLFTSSTDGPAEDLRADEPLIKANATRLATQIRSLAGSVLPALGLARQWHCALYVGCHVPSNQYVGNFRGDSHFPHLVDDEVGTNERDAFGRNLWTGIPPRDAQAALNAFEQGLRQELSMVDASLPPANPAKTSADLHRVAVVAGVAHGEWLRIHPFANGNGRTARAWVHFLTARYGLPYPWEIKPRPSDPSYLRATRSSLGRPPQFAADHRPTIGLLSDRLRRLTGVA